jgi:CRP/FNR family transcriptional regulator, cyclic AMP receptor protein
MVVTPDLLRSFSVLKRLADNDLLGLAQRSSLRKFTRRGIVLNAGEKEDHVCLLFEGRLQGVDFTIDGREVGLYFVQPGEFCGELGLFDHGSQPEYVIALTPSVVVFVPMSGLREIMDKTPAIANTLGLKLANRVRQMIFQRSLLGLPNIPQRVCCQLWALVPTRDREAVTASAIANPPTHMEIAIMLNVSRETVTRVFQTLQKRQIVIRDGSTNLIINEVKTLKDFAEGKETI